MPTLEIHRMEELKFLKFKLKQNHNFEFVWREHEESELFDLVNFGDVAF